MEYGKFMKELEMVNSLRALLIIAISAIMLTGCGYKEERIVVQEKVKTVYVLPPKEATEKIEIPAPISKEKYLSLNIKDREKELGIYTTKLLSAIKIENAKKEEVLKYIESLDKTK